MALRCNHREGITQGHEHIFTNVGALASKGIAPRRDSTGDDFKVTQAGAGTVNVNPGWAFLKAKTGDTKYYFVENTATETLTVPTGFSSVVLYLDPTITPNSDGSNVVFLTVVSGSSTSTPTNSDIEASIGTDKPWLRLADVSWDGTTMKIADRRVWASGHWSDAVGDLNYWRVGRNLAMNSDFRQGRFAWQSSDWSLVNLDSWSGHLPEAKIDVPLGTTWTMTYDKLFKHPDEPHLFAGAQLVATCRWSKVSGDQEAILKVFKVDTSSVRTLVTSTHLSLGGDTRAHTDFPVVHFQMPSDSNFDHMEIEIEISGGTTAGTFYFSQFGIYRGVIPVAWSPRPWVFEPRFYTVWNWVSTSGWGNSGQVNVWNIFGDKKIFGASVRLHAQGAGASTIAEIRGYDKNGNVISMARVDAIDGHGWKNAEPGFVTLNQNGEYQWYLSFTGSTISVAQFIVGVYKFV